MDCKGRLEKYLRENKVSFQVQHHPLAYTSQQVAAAEHLPGKILAKVVMVLADGELVMLALPAPYEVDLDQAVELLGATHVRLATEAEFGGAFPDCDVGAMPPFGNLYGLPLYVDRTLAEEETIVFQAGTHTDTTSISYADFSRLARPTVGDFARHRVKAIPEHRP